MTHSSDEVAAALEEIASFFPAAAEMLSEHLVEMNERYNQLLVESKEQVERELDKTLEQAAFIAHVIDLLELEDQEGEAR